MARYANHECAGCGLILPAYELQRVEDTVETGTSRTQRRIRNTGMYTPSSVTKHYAKRGKLLCGPCRTKRAIGKAVTFIGGGALLLLVVPKGPSPAPAPSQAVEPTQIVSKSTPDEVVGEPVTDRDAPSHEASAPDTRDYASTAPIAADPVAASGAMPSSRETLAAQIIAAPASFEPVQKAMQEALERGTARRWHSDHLHGWAVPSALMSDACRVVPVSIDRGPHSTPERMCPAKQDAGL